MKDFNPEQKNRNQKHYTCETCGKSFSEAVSLKKHITTVHEGHKDYKCEFCDKSASCLKKQMHTIHEGHKDYKCESCGKLFSDLQLFCNLLMFVIL